MELPAVDQAWPLERYRDYLLQLARIALGPRGLGPHDPADLAQQALLKAHQHRDQFHGRTETELLGWLRTILANTIRDALRSLGRAPEPRSLDRVLEDSSARLGAWLGLDQSSPSERVMRHEQHRRLEEALSGLPEDQRIALELHHLRGISVPAVGRIMGRSTKSVAGLIRRGMQALRARLDADRGEG